MGANRNYGGRLRLLERVVVKMYGQFVGAGAAPVTNVDCLGFTIARTGVGLFTITLDDAFPIADATPATAPLLLITSFRLSAAARATGEMQAIVDLSGTSTRTITTRWAEAGAAADVAAGDIIRLELSFRNTGLPRKGF